MKKGLLLATMTLNIRGKRCRINQSRLLPLTKELLSRVGYMNEARSNTKEYQKMVRDVWKLVKPELKMRKIPKQIQVYHNTIFPRAGLKDATLLVFTVDFTLLAIVEIDEGNPIKVHTKNGFRIELQAYTPATRIIFRKGLTVDERRIYGLTNQPEHPKEKFISQQIPQKELILQTGSEVTSSPIDFDYREVHK